ncbi:hypothetical protein J6590_072143 [Homalodisca vitripennis]|nr:hypothetical protein J6590_072143 [Homalodisca vitripennis]
MKETPIQEQTAVIANSQKPVLTPLHLNFGTTIAADLASVSNHENFTVPASLALILFHKECRPLKIEDVNSLGDRHVRLHPPRTPSSEKARFLKMFHHNKNTLSVPRITRREYSRPRLS